MNRVIPDSRAGKIWMAAAITALLILATAAIISCIVYRDTEDMVNPLELSSDVGEHVYIKEILGDDTDASGSSEAAGNYAMTHPGLLVEDENGKIWSSEMRRVRIFKVRYLGPDGYAVTVNSENGDRLIAPGTENDYDFTLRNKSDATVGYRISVETSVDPEDLFIPVDARLIDPAGKSNAGWRDFKALDGYTDSGTLKGHHAESYTFEWKWPFERGEGGTLIQNDAWDTYLGNMAVGDELTVTVVLRVLSWQMNPKTGDDTNLLLYALLFAASLVLMLIILLFSRRKREEDDDEKAS